jgi:hypothetical protein
MRIVEAIQVQMDVTVDKAALNVPMESKNGDDDIQILREELARVAGSTNTAHRTTLPGRERIQAERL